MTISFFVDSSPLNSIYKSKCYASCNYPTYNHGGGGGGGHTSRHRIYTI